MVANPHHTRTHYEILEVDRTASMEEVRAAFRRRAKATHPDMQQVPGYDHADFVAVQTAYQILSDPFSRANFVRLMLEQALRGAVVSVRVNKKYKCEKCQATGVELIRGSACITCEGTGYRGAPNLFHRIFSGEACSECKKSGYTMVPQTCGECHGSGYISRSKHVEIPPYPGISDNTMVSVPGETFKIKIREIPHVEFIREGYNIRKNITLGAARLARGTKLSVNGLDGISRTVYVPPNSRVGDRIILPRCGIPQVNSRHIGDLIIHITMPSET